MKFSKTNLTCCAYKLCRYMEGGKVYPFSVTCKGDRHNWNSDIVGTFPTWMRTNVTPAHWLGNLPELLAAACCRRNGAVGLFNLRMDEFQDKSFPHAVPKERILLKTLKYISMYAICITKKQVRKKQNRSFTCALLSFCIFYLPITKSLCSPRLR